MRVHSINNISTPQLIGRFAEARTREYQELIRDLEEFSSMPMPKRSMGRLSRLRARFREIVEVDFFDSSCRSASVSYLRTQTNRGWRSRGLKRGRLIHESTKGRLWVTRPRPGVDRSASAWLIRQFIDRKARFTFAPEDRVPSEAIPFDMYHGGFRRRGEDCTFETLQKDFKIRDGRVKVISEIVHDADLADAEFGRNEGYGVDKILKGWAQPGIADQEFLLEECS